VASTATATTTKNNNNIPNWKISGDFFDAYKCNIPCPCEFGQATTYGDCNGVLAWDITKEQYGQISIDGLNVLGLGSFTGKWKRKGQSSKHISFEWGCP
jgi:hypothetical protein